MKMTIKGGRELRANLERIGRRLHRESEKKIRVGWTETARKRPGDDRPTATVAWQNEYGSRDQAARPFFREALPKAASGVMGEMGRAVNLQGWVRRQRLLQAGEVLRDEVRKSIAAHRVVDTRHLYQTIEVKEGRRGED